MEGILTGSIFVALIIGGLIGYSIGNDKAERERKERDNLFSVLIDAALHPHPVSMFKSWWSIVRRIESDIDTTIYKDNELRQVFKNCQLIKHYKKNAEEYIDAIAEAINEYEQKRHSIKFPKSELEFRKLQEQKTVHNEENALI